MRDKVAQRRGFCNRRAHPPAKAPDVPASSPSRDHAARAAAARAGRPEGALVRGMFSAITPSYDRLNRLLSGSLDRRWRALAARRTLEGLAPCQRLLDVATGTGDLARALQIEAARLGHRPRIAGADFTRPMLARAAAKFPDPAFRWAEADAERLPFPAAAFDAVTIAFGLRNVTDRGAALAEFARVVRPGGRVAILEFGQPRNRALRLAYDCYSFTILPRLGRLLSGSDAYLYLARSIREFWPPAELADRMRAAGLREIRAIPILGGIVYLHLGTRP